MDLLEEYKKQFVLSKERILSEIDEFTLYYFYLGIKDLTIRKTYTSPIRNQVGDYDENPSFSLFENTRSKREVEYLWKDSGKNLTGDIWDLLKLMFGLSEIEVLDMINSDFSILDDSKEIVVNRIERPSKSESVIRIKSIPFTKEGLEFWNSYYIPEELLNWKQVKQVKYVWYSQEQEHPYICKNLTFAYPEYNYKTKDWRYQLYAPYEKKEFKFRNSLSQNQVYGYNHLKYSSKKLIITKSNKDIICLKKFGIESISPRSETTKIKLKTIELLKTKYDELVTLFDNDEAGKKASLDYELPSLFIPESSGHKDFSDFLKGEGEDKAFQLLKELKIC